MKLIYAMEPIPNDNPMVFLVGPTPRSPEVPSWRPDFIEALDKAGYNGTVIIPEDRDGPRSSYDGQVEWEQEGLDKCSAILAWVPRQLKTMPAFTTNIEIGLHLKSGKLFYGRPDWAAKKGYLDYSYKKYVGRVAATTMEELIQAYQNLEIK